MNKKSKIAKERSALFDKIVLILNIIAALALLLSYLAPSTDPRDFSLIASLGFGYLVLLLINILFIIFWSIKYRFYFLISTLAILSGYTILIANFGFHFNTSITKNEIRTGTIRVMAYNVNVFKGIEEHEEDPTQERVMQVLRENNVDIMCFEEFGATRSNNVSTRDSIKNILKSVQYFYKRMGFIANRDTFGNAIFSKFPIIDTGSIAAPTPLAMRAIFADIKYKSKILRIYCVHLAAVGGIKGSDKRKILDGSGILDKSSFLNDKVNSAFLIRSYQVSRIKEHMSECPYPYIVAGDFNDTPISYAVNTLSYGLKNAFIEKGSGFETTYYSTFPLHIDYILCSPQFDVLSYKSIDKKISDHKPIVSELRLK
jgi:endonuclease/exonuclease/phosphatase family metal-dependent hydrolase